MINTKKDGNTKETSLKIITLSEAACIEKDISKAIFCNERDGRLFFIVCSVKVPITSCIGGYQCALNKHDKYIWKERYEK